MLSWIERKAAATLFATPPSATIDETLQHFLTADGLNPNKWKDNILFIAKVCAKLLYMNVGQLIPWTLDSMPFLDQLSMGPIVWLPFGLVYSK